MPSALVNHVSDADFAAYNLVSHEISDRIVRIEAREDCLDAFFEEVAMVDVQELEYVPFQRFHLANCLQKHLGPTLGQDVNRIARARETGAFVFDLRNVRTDPDSFVKFGTAISHLLGPTNHDAMSGKFYARFLVEHTDNSDSYLRQAYRLFTLHTDGTFADEATDWLLMMKFQELNGVGGESRLLHIDDWAECRALASSPLGRKPMLYKAPGSKNVSTVIERPLFFDGPFGMGMSFIDQFVNPRTMEEALFLKGVSASMEESSGTMEVPLAVGELIVLNNHFWLHGRAAFQENPLLHRELMRQRGVFAE